MNKFMKIKGTLLKVKQNASNGSWPVNSFDPFIEACLSGYANDLTNEQLKILFDSLGEIEDVLRKRGRPLVSVGDARKTLLFVLENNND
jgi:hypothetical protein